MECKFGAVLSPDQLKFRLLEQGKLSEISGTIVVDEVHLISDPARGYILELLLAKVLYMSRKYGIQFQIITMSATLANKELLKKWLNAELYITNFRPVALQEMIKLWKIYDKSLNFLRSVTEVCANIIEPFPELQNDTDHVAQLCIETLVEGLDAVLEKCITYGCSFHHAGLTTEERDILEASFKSGALRVIVATSTLSSGVNLPARRVLIRSPLFGGKQMSSLTYRQMIGRAGRTGKTHLKRALLEVISSGVATSKEDINNFVNCTLLCVQNQLMAEENNQQEIAADEYIGGALNFLIEYEFVRLQNDENTQEQYYVATQLGNACLELHAVYLVTPYSVCYQLQDLDWLLFLDLWEKLPPAMKKVGELVGVKESFLVRAMRGQSKLDYKLMQIHKRVKKQENEDEFETIKRNEARNIFITGKPGLTVAEAAKLLVQEAR
ncbi:DNA polymerase theta, partial [Eumeta japonica]